MDTRTLIPIALILVGGAAGYVIYRKVTAKDTPLPVAPGAVLPAQQAEPGIAAKYGKFDIFLPTSGITDLIKGLKGGGTKQEKQVAVIKKPVGLPSLPGPAILPYRPSYVPTPALYK